jgi:hypothetical protein
MRLSKVGIDLVSDPVREVRIFLQHMDRERNWKCPHDITEEKTAIEILQHDDFNSRINILPFKYDAD